MMISHVKTKTILYILILSLSSISLFAENPDARLFFNHSKSVSAEHQKVFIGNVYYVDSSGSRLVTLRRSERKPGMYMAGYSAPGVSHEISGADFDSGIIPMYFRGCVFLKDRVVLFVAGESYGALYEYLPGKDAVRLCDINMGDMEKMHLLQFDRSTRTAVFGDPLRAQDKVSYDIKTNIKKPYAGEIKDRAIFRMGEAIILKKPGGLKGIKLEGKMLNERDFGFIAADSGSCKTEYLFIYNTKKGVLYRLEPGFIRDDHAVPIALDKKRGLLMIERMGTRGGDFNTVYSIDFGKTKGTVPPGLEKEGLSFSRRGGSGILYETKDGLFCLTNLYDGLLLAKISSEGEEVRVAEIEGMSYRQGLKSLLPLADGYLIGSRRNMTTDKYTFKQECGGVLLKADLDGTIKWQVDFKDTGCRAVSSLCETENGMVYALVEKGYNGDESMPGIYLYKIDGGGNMLNEVRMEKQQVGHNFGRLFATTEENFIVFTSAADGGYGKACVTKFNSAGKTIWSQEYGDKPMVVSGDLIQANGGGYVLCGGLADSWKSHVWDGMFVKIDHEGKELMHRKFDNFRMNDICAARDGGYVAVGIKVNRDTQHDMAVMKVDEEGNKLWEKVFPTCRYDSGDSIVSAADGYYYVLGSSGSLQNHYLVKLDKDGNVMWK